MTKSTKKQLPIEPGAKQRQKRNQAAVDLLKRLEAKGVRDVEIAFKLGVSIQTVWRWMRDGRAPTPLYFEALQKFAEEKGVPA